MDNETIDDDWWGVKRTRKNGNDHLNIRKDEPNDELYTNIEDIEREVAHYPDAFRGKVVYCNCDQDWSAFPRFFERERERLGLKGLIRHAGPFGGTESIELLKQADIVATNPPFSLFGGFIRQLIEYEKAFLVIGPLLGAALDAVIPAFVAGVARLGYTHASWFKRPDGSAKRLGNTVWFTSLPVHRDPLHLVAEYSPDEYPRDQNRDVIHVARTDRIPKDWDGVMGVPVSFLEKHDHRQFEIVGKGDVLCLGNRTKRVFIRKKSA